MFIKAIPQDNGLQEYIIMSDDEVSIMDMDLMLEVQAKEGCTVCTKAGFAEAHEKDLFNRFDGDGFFHNGTSVTDMSVWDANIDKAAIEKCPYICWFNK